MTSIDLASEVDVMPTEDLAMQRIKISRCKDISYDAIYGSCPTLQMDIYFTKFDVIPVNIP